jgi:hypothetical protein
MNHLKRGLLTSILALGFLSIVACGKDSSKNSQMQASAAACLADPTCKTQVALATAGGTAIPAGVLPPGTVVSAAQLQTLQKNLATPATGNVASVASVTPASAIDAQTAKIASASQALSSNPETATEGPVQAAASMKAASAGGGVEKVEIGVARLPDYSAIHTASAGASATPIEETPSSTSASVGSGISQ